MRICRTLSISILAAFLSAGTLTFADADARSISYDLNIPSEDLTAALQSFAIASHHKLLYKAELTAGKTSRALKGHFTAQEAMEALLLGTGLSYEITGSSVVLIKDIPGSKTSELREDGNTPSSPRAAPQSSEAQPILLAQADQAKSTSDVPVDKSENKSKKDKSEGLSEIVVTGTYIHNIQPITPVTVITHEDLVNQGYTTLAGLIEQLPQTFKAGASQESNTFNNIGNGSANNYTFASGVNLRGLGAGATLVLLNGRRLAPTAYGGVTDISQIPIDIIERVEILTDGASALYGSDAVAGVVNIITKRDFSGFEVTGRVNSIAKGKAPNYDGNALAGVSWGSGNVLVDFNYETDNPLFARNRSFTESLPDPTTLFPDARSTHIYASLEQRFGDQWKLSGDAMLTDRRFSAEAPLLPGPGVPVSSNWGSAKQYSTSWQLDYRISTEWTATLIGQASRELDDLSTIQIQPGPFGFYEAGRYYPFAYDVYALEPRIEGPIFDAPGGAARLAIGGQYRRESFEQIFFEAFAPGTPETLQTNVTSGRRITSAYGELMVPLIGENNATPYTQRLRLDISGRYDDYSDFGRTTNPKFALDWVPISGLTAHASYSRSFQAPALYEVSNAFNYGYVASVPDPLAATGSSTSLIINSTNPNLQPETAKNINAGLTFEPAVVPGLKIDASFFSVNFKSEIVWLLGDEHFFTNVLQEEGVLGSLVQRNPSLSEVNAALSAPGRTIIPLSGPIVPSQISAIAYIGYANTASLLAKGVDLTAAYSRQVTTSGRLHADLDGSFITTYREQITPTAASESTVNTIYHPLRFRAKANIGWDEGNWRSNARVNYSNAYQNTNAVNPNCPGASDCGISAWTTIDLAVIYGGPRSGTGPLAGWQFGVEVTNVFNRQPPAISGPPGIYPYDAVNASALMRAFGITVSKAWK